MGLFWLFDFIFAFVSLGPFLEIFSGGVPQACTLYAEYMPTHVRGRAVMTLSFFWALGALFLAFLAWAVMPELGWRYLVGFSVLPLASFVVMSPFILPESPFYLASIGNKKQVEIELAKVAKMNKKPALLGTLELCEATNKAARGRILDLFISNRRRLTIQTCFSWFVGAGTYYGAVLLSTELLNSNQGICLASGE